MEYAKLSAEQRTQEIGANLLKSLNGYARRSTMQMSRIDSWAEEKNRVIADLEGQARAARVIRQNERRGGSREEGGTGDVWCGRHFGVKHITAEDFDVEHFAATEHSDVKYITTEHFDTEQHFDDECLPNTSSPPDASAKSHRW